MFHLTPKSGNGKTGPIAVSTSTAKTCPGSCPFNHANAGGCYADAGPLALHWRKVTDGYRGTEFAGFLAEVERLAEGLMFRHNQAGDLPGDGDAIDGRALSRLCKSASHLRAFTYTHKPIVATDGVPAAVVRRNRAAVKRANDSGGMVINVSANDLDHADRLWSAGVGPVAVVLQANQTENVVTPNGRRVVVCPAAIRDDVTCESCGLCAVRDRAVIVGFPAHGPGARRASAVAKGACK